jgi:hypothetical protein
VSINPILARLSAIGAKKLASDVCRRAYLRIIFLTACHVPVSSSKAVMVENNSINQKIFLDSERANGYVTCVNSTVDGNLRRILHTAAPPGAVLLYKDDGH